MNNIRVYKQVCDLKDYMEEYTDQTVSQLIEASKHITAAQEILAQKDRRSGADRRVSHV